VLLRALVVLLRLVLQEGDAYAGTGQTKELRWQATRLGLQLRQLG